MNSEDSGDEAPIQPLAMTASTLLPLMNSLEADMSSLSKKVTADSVTWLRAPVIPVTDALQGLWLRYGVPSSSSIHTLLNAIFDNAKSVDLASRVIQFSDEDAVSLGLNSMTIYELLHLVIDSVDFCAP
jgi:hypothetical protein